MKEMYKKAVRRMAIINKVAHTKWGMESRILTVTTHALVESLVNYGLAVTGSNISTIDQSRVDSSILSRVARKIVGVGPTIRREILHVGRYQKLQKSLCTENG